jgi:hypothetical protein
MRALPLVLLVLAACARAPSRVPGPPASVTLSGSAPGLETWEAEAAVDRHLHPLEGAGCEDLPRVLKTSGEFAGAVSREPRVAEAAESISGLVHALISQSHGAPYGGPERLTLALRHVPEADRALFVVLPRLRPEETERTFRDAEIRADYHQPMRTVQATLESGRVSVRRTSGDLCEFELFLVLRPRGGADSLQVVTRVEAPVAR